MRLRRSGFLDKARKEAASAWKCQSLRFHVVRGRDSVFDSFRYRQDSAPTDKPHRREFRPRFFFLDISRIHAYKPISPSPYKAPDIPVCMVVCIKRKPAQWRASKRRSGWRGEVGRPRGCTLGQRLSSRRSAQSSSDALGPKLDAVPRADPWTEGLPSRRSGCNCRGCRRSVRRFSRPNRTPCTPW